VEAEVIVTHRTRRDAQFAVAAFVFTMLLAMVSPVYANNFGPYFADNGSHSRYYDAGFTAGARAATDWSINYSYQPTDMNWYYTTTDIHGSNDTWYTVDPLPGSIIGLTDCRALQDPDECEHFHVTYDEPWWIGAGDVARRSLACHENGHTVGLQHGPYGCMPSSPTSQYLGAHNANHINSRY
jgi:hypothetical protein